eukprot:COSAG05_NODE_498_length_9248_cov_20.530003_4_plen_155_part_00
MQFVYRTVHPSMHWWFCCGSKLSETHMLTHVRLLQLHRREFSLDLEHALARQAVEMMTPHDSDPKETSIYHLNAGSVKDCKSEVFPSRDSTLYDTSHPTIAKAMARHPNEYNADGSVKDTKRKTHIKTTNPLLQTKSIVDLDVVGGVGGGDDDE